MNDKEKTISSGITAVITMINKNFLYESQRRCCDGKYEWHYYGKWA